MRSNNQIKIKKLDQRGLEIIPLLVDLSNGNFFKNDSKPKMSEKISLIAQIENIPFGEISSWTFNSIDEVFSKIIGMMNDYSFNEPPKSLTVNGVDYDLILEPRKQSGGWWNHLDQITAHTSPESFLGLAYMERGRIYSETDSRGNVLNPSDERGAAVGSKYSASMFLDLMGFFLGKFESVSILTSVYQSPKAMIEIKRGRNPMNGKKF